MTTGLCRFVCVIMVAGVYHISMQTAYYCQHIYTYVPAQQHVINTEWWVLCWSVSGGVIMKSEVWANPLIRNVSYQRLFITTQKHTQADTRHILSFKNQSKQNKIYVCINSIVCIVNSVSICNPPPPPKKNNYIKYAFTQAISGTMHIMIIMFIQIFFLIFHPNPNKRFHYYYDYNYNKCYEN